MQAKDIQNQRRTVNNLDRFAHGFLKIGLLRGRQVVVEDNNIRIHTMHQTAQLLDLAGADKRFGIGFDQALRQACDALGSSSVGQTLELVKRTVERPGVIAPLNTNQDGALGFRRRGDQRKTSH